jgi:hypothetical protein
MFENQSLLPNALGTLRAKLISAAPELSEIAVAVIAPRHRADLGILVECVGGVAHRARRPVGIVEPGVVGHGLADPLVHLVVGVAEGDAAGCGHCCRSGGAPAARRKYPPSAFSNPERMYRNNALSQQGELT